MNHIELARWTARECNERRVEGRGSPIWFFNRKKISTNGELLAELAKHMSQRIPDDIDLIVGIANGGTAITQALATVCRIPTGILIKNCEGKLSDLTGVRYRAGMRAILTDDTVCHGWKTGDAKEILEKLGIITTGIACVSVRGEAALDRLRQQRINLYPLFTGEELRGCL